MHRVWIVGLLTVTACSNDNGLRRLLEPPDALIGSPVPESEFRLGEGPLEVVGTVLDSHDTPMTLVAWWAFDGEERDAEIGEDGTVTVELDTAGLELGTHTIELGVTDSDRETDVASVSWVLAGPAGPPTVEITSPADGSVFQVGDEILFRGTASDTADEASDLEFVWTSSLDGELAGAISADGQSLLPVGMLSVGAHTISLDVTDTDGEVGSDSIGVEVNDEPVIAQPGDLVFSELAVNPNVVADEVGEWVELYNTSGSTIDLAGYTFHDLDYDYFELPSTIVPPGEYVVLCAQVDSTINGGNTACDAKFQRDLLGGRGSMALGNNGDEVVLSRPDGTVIDQVVYSGSWFTPGKATGLDPERLDASNNDDESMWCDQRTIVAGMSEAGTPGQENDGCD